MIQTHHEPERQGLQSSALNVALSNAKMFEKAFNNKRDYFFKWDKQSLREKNLFFPQHDSGTQRNLVGMKGKNITIRIKSVETNIVSHIIGYSF